MNKNIGAFCAAIMAIPALTLSASPVQAATGSVPGAMPTVRLQGYVGDDVLIENVNWRKDSRGCIRIVSGAVRHVYAGTTQTDRGRGDAVATMKFTTAGGKSIRSFGETPLPQTFKAGDLSCGYSGLAVEVDTTVRGVSRHFERVLVSAGK